MKTNCVFPSNLLVILGSIILLTVSITSCKLNPSIMLQTERGYEFDSIPSNPSAEYKLDLNDRISFRLFSKNGFKIIDLTSFTSVGANAVNFSQSFQYTIEADSTVKLPIVGRIKLGGLTIRQAERMLEGAYGSFYNDPFVMINVLNRRVVVFSGNDGRSKVVTLVNENTTLIEGLAMAGGLTEFGKAYKIKLIRGDGGPETKVFLIDLSTIEGINAANMVLQSNDIIYVEPQIRAANDILRQITPIVTIITSAVVLVTALNQLNR